MEHAAIWELGCWLMASAAALYMLSWVVVVCNPAWLVGTITTLWFRSLVYVLLGGLLLDVLWAVDKILQTFLYWRQ